MTQDVVSNITHEVRAATYLVSGSSGTMHKIVLDVHTVTTETCHSFIVPRQWLRTKSPNKRRRGSAALPNVLPAADKEADGKMTSHDANLQEVVIGAIRAASTDSSIVVALSTEIADVVDSMGFFSALAGIQDKLAVPLATSQLFRMLRCRSVNDLIGVLESL